MNNVDELFDLINNCDFSRVIKYKYRMALIKIIYMCLKYRYSYQIGLNQKKKWIDKINSVVADYCPNTLFYIDADYKINFFIEGEALKEIFDEVVNFMSYQGYHDIPGDLYKEFTRDKICILDENDNFKNLLTDSWIRKYARGSVIKCYLEI